MLRFLIFNVGHGFCAYAVTPSGASILFDCGYDDELQFYPSRYFKDRGIVNIHNLVLSHFDQDHVCDLPAIRRQAFISSITRNPSVPSAFIRQEKMSGGVVTAAMTSALEMHEGWTTPLQVPMDYGGVRLTYFYNRHPRFLDTNNLSLVTFMEYEGFGIVVPGDLESDGWEALLQDASFRACLSRTSIFIASHHGRHAGYCETVFRYCSPDLILLSDKNLVHQSQEHDYAKHARGVTWPGNKFRRVLTTRCDGHILIEKESNQIANVYLDIAL
ncbi:ComEC/Rec2 family competence protein [Terriglobus sp. 2YAB30_2]|uniref:ComEC/Rec2 family competence protein n=2 Tax=unclassified Terriglobus TaxID=2628988 RepID=UPI003F9B41D7